MIGGGRAVTYAEIHPLPSTSTPQNIQLTRKTASTTRVRQLERMLDMRPFLAQLDKLLAMPIKIPSSSLLQYPGSSNKTRHSIFSVKAVWTNEAEAERAIAQFYNVRTIHSRKWLKKVLVEESDSDSDGEIPFTQLDLRALLKVHRRRRKLQKNYHSDVLNSQYTYYAAGLLSSHDPFPEHQSAVLNQYAYS
ncbi:hypothetical protein AB6A40_003541 [Gnathostoma spinigerum]|uniref:Uncharacterized protein n=1 Tax=Gnathostoma spinigerum TaxID=75299 RepID=A0ABD6EJH4_9BILA